MRRSEPNPTPRASGSPEAASGKPRTPYGRATPRTPRWTPPAEPRDLAVRRAVAAEARHREPLPASDLTVLRAIADRVPTGGDSVVLSIIAVANATGRTVESVTGSLRRLIGRGYLRRSRKLAGDTETATTRIRWSLTDG